MAVTTETRDGVAWVRMDDGKVNALSMALLEALDGALDEAAEASAVVLCGRPGRFSAGFDLGQMMAGPESARALVSRGGQLCMRLFQHPKPVLAACTGHAMAGGALLLLSCDHRVGLDLPCKIGLNETSLGVPLPGFALALAKERLARQHLCRATLQATIYDAAGACAVGFLDETVAPDALEAKVQAEALRLTALNPRAFARSKHDQRGAVAAAVLAGLDENLRGIVAG